MSRTVTPAPPARHRARIAIAFASFVFIGLGAGVGGVLLPAQIADYQITKSTYGFIFVAFSAGYLLSGAASGTLVARLGVRGDLAAGAGLYLAAAVAAAAGPPFAVLVLLNLLLGFGTGVLDAGLNAYLAALPRNTALLNMLHAFFGVGALLGPVFAEVVLATGHTWRAVYLLLAALAAPLLACFVLLFPAVTPRPAGEHPLLRTTARHAAVWLGGLFLCLYVGVETSIGNWGFSLLTSGGTYTSRTAAWLVSGYWLGLTAGRFTLSRIAERLRLDASTLSFACLAGVLGSLLLAWLGGAAGSAAGLVLTGYFLGPLFPTTIAVVPRLVSGRLVPTAVGLLVGLSVLGGAAFPWLAGTLAQWLGFGSLLPYTLALGVLLVASWWAVARRLAPPPAVVAEIG